METPLVVGNKQRVAGIERNNVEDRGSLDATEVEESFLNTYEDRQQRNSEGQLGYQPDGNPWARNTTATSVVWHTAPCLPACVAQQRSA
jgi:hypothetical protein